MILLHPKCQIPLPTIGTSVALRFHCTARMQQLGAQKEPLGWRNWEKGPGRLQAGRSSRDTSWHHAEKSAHGRQEAVKKGSIHILQGSRPPPLRAGFDVLGCGAGGRKFTHYFLGGAHLWHAQNIREEGDKAAVGSFPVEGSRCGGVQDCTLSLPPSTHQLSTPGLTWHFSVCPTAGSGHHLVLS